MGFLLSSILNAVTTILAIAIILRALLSFAPLDPGHPLVRMLHQLTEPILRPIRNIMPSAGMIDFSPMIALILLTVINQVLQQLLLTLFG